jgi:hypothetical protein
MFKKMTIKFFQSIHSLVASNPFHSGRAGRHGSGNVN